MLVLSHGAVDHEQPERMDAIREHYRRTSHPLQRRTHAEIAGLLAGWDVLDPGLVDANLWRPDDLNALVSGKIAMLAAVARRS
jgi:hypothetical protein